MNVTLNLNSDMEKGLTARAHAPGVSLDDDLNSPFAGANLDLERSKDHPRRLSCMSGFLIDTNVLSEYNRPGAPDAGVKRWLEPRSIH